MRKVSTETTPAFIIWGEVNGIKYEAYNMVKHLMGTSKEIEKASKLAFSFKICFGNCVCRSQF